jgi:3-oxoadipate enol-lactonase
MKARNGAVELAWESHGSGEPLLMIHGLGYARWGWEPLVPLLADHFTVVTFDNRGIGESSVPPGPYTAETMSGDALAVLTAAGFDSAYVAGSSLGGMIAQELAIRSPEQVAKLVLLSTTPGASLGHPMPAVTVELLANAATMDPEEALRRFVENALGPDPDRSVIERILHHRTSNLQDPVGWAAQAAAGTTYDGGDRLAAIKCPTLAISGTADHVIDYRNSEVLADLIPDARLHLVEAGGHLVFWEHPEEVAEQMIAFLS